jgi:beta-glucanase (GH16 family)
MICPRALIFNPQKLNLMRALRFAFVAVFLFAGLSLYGQTWNLVWADEFNTSIGPDWVFETGTGSGGWGNNELQYYRSQNASVSGGALVITARRESFGGMQYTSARMKTQGRKSWRYGRVEARISMPSFQGVWPAFWMLGDNITSVGWPACGEIDIMEHVNTGGTTHGTIHWQDHNGNYANYGGSTSTSITSYHTYAIEWNSSAIKWFVDGVQFHEANILNGINGTSEFHNNFFVILNMAIGGNWPGFTIDNNAFPAEMRIDYVRVYQLGGTPPPTGAPIGQTIAMRGNNNQYVSGENGTAPMRCNRATAQAWEHFTVVDAGSGLIALRSMNKYVSSGNGTAAMTANATSIGTQQRFTWVSNSDGTFSLRGNNNQYVSSENGVANMMCNRTSIQAWEKFTRVTISGGRLGGDELDDDETIAQNDYIDDLTGEDFAVFPNPACDHVTIRVARPSNVRLVSMTGVTVHNEDVAEIATVNGLSPGIYIVNVSSEGRNARRRLMVK